MAPTLEKVRNGGTRNPFITKMTKKKKKKDTRGSGVQGARGWFAVVFQPLVSSFNCPFLQFTVAYEEEKKICVRLGHHSLLDVAVRSSPSTDTVLAMYGRRAKIRPEQEEEAQG